MTTPRAIRSTRDRPALVRWILPVGVGLLLAIGVLWSIPAPEVCILIYPAPPGCGEGGGSVTGPAVVGSITLVFGYAAFVACALLLPARRRPLVLGILGGVLALVFLVSLVAALSGSAQPTPYPVY